MFNDEEIVLNAKRRIGFVEMEDIIDTIAEGVFDDGRYMPSRFDYYYYACILYYWYTNWYRYQGYVIGGIYISSFSFELNLINGCFYQKISAD